MQLHNKQKLPTALVLSDEPIMCQMIFPRIFKDIEDLGKSLNYEIIHVICPKTFEQYIDQIRSSNSHYDLIILDFQYQRNESLFLRHSVKYSKSNIKGNRLLIRSSTQTKHAIRKAYSYFNPDGFLIRTDSNYDDLLQAALEVLQGTKIYSKSIEDVIVSDKSFYDELDIDILFHLSNGVPTAQLPQKLLVSLSCIEQRKRKMADLFGMESAKTQLLLMNAKEHKWI